MIWTGRLSELSRNSTFARALWLAVAVLISWLHLFMNTLRITHSDLLLDDAGTWGVARRSLATLVTLPTEFHSQPPLYYYLLHFLLNISSSPWFLRGISWVFCWLLLLFVLFCWHELSLLSRLAFCLIFLFSNLAPYLSTCVRPYGLAALLTLVSSVTLLRLARQPTSRRAVVYAAWTIAMLYTMAFEVAVLLVHGLVVVAVIVGNLARRNRVETLRRSKILALTMLAVGIAYTPYLLLAYHFQYRSNPTDTLAIVLRLGTYAGTLQEQFGFSTEINLILGTLAALAFVGELCRKNWLVGLWPLLIVGPIAFVWYFISGRSPIGAQAKYMMPALLAVCALTALGFEQVRPAIRRGFWPVLVVSLAVLVASKFPAFDRFMKSGPDLGPWALLHQELQHFPGKKLVFFDVGYEGQRPAYVTREDPDVTYGTMASRSWASGGDNHLTNEYVTHTILRSSAECRCFFYYLEWPDGPYAEAFVPTLDALGYRRTSSLPSCWGHVVIGYCRP